MIVDSSGELPVALPHVSDEEDEVSVFGGRGAAAVREQKIINFNIMVTSRHAGTVKRPSMSFILLSFLCQNSTVRPSARCDADMAKEFPVSSGSQHRKKVRTDPGRTRTLSFMDQRTRTLTSSIQRGPHLVFLYVGG